MPGNFHEVPEWVLSHWPEPNYVDPVRRTWMAPFAIVQPAVSTVLIAGRFWLRATKQAGGFGLDDVFIAIGWVCYRHCQCAVLSDNNTGLLSRPLRPRSHGCGMVRHRSTHLGRSPFSLRRRSPSRLGGASPLPHQHLRDEDLRPPVPPAHGGRHL